MKIRVLIVDDQDDIRFSISDGLSQFSDEYKFEFVSSGDECLEKLHDIKPDVIVMDIMMPDTNGIEVASQIKRFKNLKDIPIILLSGVEDEDTKKHALMYSDAFLGKPFEIEKLHDIIQKEIKKN